ncbi:uncharacterized protein LOC127799160 [Diospyros lotus]|uniref:uncharacterized protein LOC127799160 n=1 Tax=Diospyros lotus TaxID=55363 RepID=UPI002258F63C|nr:uncharacterized protein LOC127799160 [Diospyros lotus]
MDLFKSVFSDESDLSNPQNTAGSPPGSPPDHQEEHARHSMRTITNAWSFGGLIKTLASKSESVIENYRRDLEEFGSGLRKETAVIREVAGRAVRDLPASFEAGAAAAQESLESVGEAIDNIGSSVSEIIYQGKDSILAGGFDGESNNDRHMNDNSQRDLKFNLRPYSRIDAQIRAIQRDLNTYCKEPESLEEYNEWKLGFNLDEKGEEIEILIEQNWLIQELYDQVVPSMFDRETFWSRYFYKVYKVRKAEEARAKLVKRAISGEEEEELSWDVDDDDYEENDVSKLMGDSKGEEEDQKIVESPMVESEKSLEQENQKGVASVSKSENGVDERVHLDGSESSSSKLEVKSNEKLGSKGKIENAGLCKDGNLSVVASQPSRQEEEELGWDEIEDIENSNGINLVASGSPNRADLRKRLSAMEEEEDLGWGSEDDEKPVKS